jgi:hypothetical protein
LEFFWAIFLRSLNLSTLAKLQAIVNLVANETASKIHKSSLNRDEGMAWSSLRAE